jgi:peptidyl-dipeptidase Dcp
LSNTHNGDEAIKIEPWDWRFYAERVRTTSYNLDNSIIKPYFPLNRMIQAIFDCAHELFGLTFEERSDIAAYHPDVQVYEVKQRQSEGEEMKAVAIFLHDNYARPHKRSGAWMSSFRVQHRNHEHGDTSPSENVIPIVINNNNFNKPSSPNEPCLLSFDDAVTLFHEFGHGLHGMLSNVTYKRLSGTSVLKDFVELPSQLYEHWLSESVVLSKHARHVTTNEVIPNELLQRLMKARKFNQGFQTIEYTASALVDIYLHLIETPSKETLNLIDFEQETLAKLGMPDGVVMRHRLPHFQRKFLFD